MSAIELTNMMSKAIDSIKSMLDVDTVIGKPIFCQDNSTIIPITKMTVGFLTAGGEMDTKYNRMKTNDLPIGGLGGGLSITPLAYLHITNGDAKIIKIEGDGVDRWLEMIHSVIRSFSKEA
ncbi:MAG: GerW family sporulation protein [Bacillota bacterium]